MKNTEIKTWLKDYIKTFETMAAVVEFENDLDFLKNIYKKFCEENNLPYISAEDLLVEIIEQENKEEKISMRFFDDEDWMLFSGAVKPKGIYQPMIGEIKVNKNSL